MVRRILQGLVFVCVLLWTMALPTFAQSPEEKTGQPLMGSEASPELPPGIATPTVSLVINGTLNTGGDEIFRVLVIGDALAGGMGAGMTRMAEDNPDIEIVNRFNESSGLARPEFYDWALALPKITITKSYDAAVVMLGSNDRQVIRGGNGLLDFGTPAWLDFYAAQTDRLLDVLKGQGLRIYWVGLPPMEDPGFDGDMKGLSDIQRQHVEARGGKFIDIRSFFVAPDGSYIDRGPDDTGTDRKLRTRDGVGFFKLGNNRLGQIVLAAVMQFESGVAPVAVAPAPANVTEPVVPVLPVEVVAAATPETVPKVGPLFGQQGSDGQDIAFDASAIVPVKPKLSVAQQQNAQTPLVNLPKQIILAATGTLAEKLFTTGETSVAPQGRFDDYTYVPLTE